MATPSTASSAASPPKAGAPSRLSRRRYYGRLVWSPDGRQLLFTTLDGAESRVFAIGVDGLTRPRLVLDGAEAGLGLLKRLTQLHACPDPPGC